MERRLKKLETLAIGADQQGVVEASHSIEPALRWPALGCRPGERPDTVAWHDRIKANHALDETGWRQAIELALSRLGIARGDARELSAMPLLELMLVAASLRDEATR